MDITVDTNVLVRGLVRDDERQAVAADAVLKQATLIAVSLPCLCELVWVLGSVYKFDATSIAAAIRVLLNTRSVQMNRPAVEQGLAFLEAGGDFADGIMLHEGRWLGGRTFVSFDKKAVAIATAQGQAARLVA